MADNLIANPGAGGATFATDEEVGVAHHPYCKLEWGPNNTFTKVDVGASAIPIQDGGNSITVDGTVAVSAVTSITNIVHVDDNAGSLTVDGSVSISGTATVDTELPAAAALADATANPTTPLVGAALEGWNGATWDRLKSTTANGLVVDVSRVQGTTAVSGTVTANQGGAPWSENITQVAGAAIAQGHGVAATAIRVELPTDGTGKLATVDTITNVVHVDDNAGSLTVDGAVTITGTATVFGNESIDQPLTGLGFAVGGRASTATPTAVSPDNDFQVIWLDRNGRVQENISQFGGSAVVTGTGVGGAGIPRVTVSSDSTLTSVATITNVVHVDDNAGSLTIDTPQLPAALVGGRLDENVGAWLGSTAPTVGSKTSANSIPVVIASDQGAISVTPSGTVTVAGAKTNNNAAPGATNVGTLPGVATAAAPTYIEGNQVALSTDLTGALRVSGGGVSVIEDVQSTGAESLSMAGAIRNDFPSIDQNLNGDYAAIKVDRYGNVKIKDVDITGTQDFMRRIAEAVESLNSSATGLPIPTQYTTTKPLPVTVEATIMGGPNTFELVSAATANSTVVKSQTASLFGWCIYNTNAAARYVKLYDSATAPTAGTKPKMTILVPGASAGAGNNLISDIGIPFNQGIAFVTVTGAADSDATSVGVNDLIINFLYL